MGTTKNNQRVLSTGLVVMTTVPVPATGREKSYEQYAFPEW